MTSLVETDVQPRTVVAMQLGNSGPANGSADLIQRLTAALGSRYRVQGEIGRGGMGLVLLAHDRRHDRPVALKVLRPEVAHSTSGERFLREIRIAARLQHPNIVPLIDSGRADGLTWYVMPFVQGESLRSRLARETQLPLADALHIAREVAEALGHAHGQGVIHRDIKPENILLAAGHALVLDFGVARAIHAAAGDRLTETGVAVGTPAYMSPEQASGAHGVDHRTDIYSLGCVLYEMLAGSPPYANASPMALLARMAREPVPGLRVVRDTVPQALEEAVMTALNKVPADRFASAADFAAALQHSIDAAQPDARPTGIRGRLAFPAASGRPIGSSAGTRIPEPWRRLGIAASILVVLGVGAWGLNAWSARERAGDDSPMQLTNTGMVISPSWSPDGRRLAVVRTDTENRSIWVRSLDDGSFLSVFDGTPGTAFVLAGWDRDGRSLVLKEWPAPDGIPLDDSVVVIRVGVPDGPRDTLQRVPETVGTTSDSPDGRYAAALGRTATGTDLITLADRATGRSDTLYVAEQDQELGLPQWGGARALYFHRRARGGQTVSLLRVDVAGDRVPLVVRRDLPAEGVVSPKGDHIAFIQADFVHTLRLIPLPEARGSIGSPRELPGGRLGLATISPEGALLASVEPDSAGEALVLHSVGTGSRRTVLTGSPRLGLPEWSGDGLRVAVRELPPQAGPARIAVINVRDGSVTRIASGDSLRGVLPGRIAWSSRGDALYVVTQPDGVLHEVPLGGGRAPRVLHDPRAAAGGPRLSHVVASPDGRHVAVSGQRLLRVDLRSGKVEDLLASEPGSRAKYLASLSIRVLAWRPDGLILYTRAPERRVLGVRARGGAAREVANLEVACDVSRASITADMQQLLCVHTSLRSDLYLLSLPRLR